MQRVDKGSAHLRAVRQLTANVAAESHGDIEAETQEALIVGTSLALLFEVGTCNRRCFGGPHILESLCGRAYNLGCSAYLLAERGFYDEALNLVRSIGEIANLVLLSVSEEGAIQAWIRADRRTRLRDFSPARVRERLERTPGLAGAMPAAADWYQELCERYTHPTPDTKPGRHNDIALSLVGGCFQASGVERVMGELAHVLAATAMVAGRFAQMKDDVDELTAIIRRNA
jgi:hypothetical protein